jgi:hypothetical protein
MRAEDERSIFVLTPSGQGLRIVNGDAVITVDRDIAPLFVRDDHFVDVLARRSDQCRDIALCQTDSDVDISVLAPLSVLLGESEDLTGDPALDRLGGERLDLFIGSHRLRRPVRCEL